MKQIFFTLLLSFLLVGVVEAKTINPANATENCAARCSEVARTCNAGCNKNFSSNKEKINCHDKCAKASSKCHARCSIHVDTCAKAYQDCLKSTSDKAKCVNFYHNCKGTGQ